MNPIDLTMEISEGLPVFPGSPGPQFIRWESIRRSGYNLELMLLSTHTGTHLDAPYHFAEDGKRVHQIPVDRLVRRATLVALPRSRNQPITMDDIARFEEREGTIKGDATLIFRTGWSRHLRRPSYFEENPGLSADAAEYLASKEANLVGIDSPSIDPGAAGDFPAHRILAGADVLILENLVGLGRIHRKQFDLVVLPLRLSGATGSPVRAIAV